MIRRMLTSFRVVPKGHSLRDEVICVITGAFDKYKDRM